MSDIKNLQPQALWQNFYLLTQVPRPSGHLEPVINFLLTWAKERGIEAFRDTANNVVFRKPATPGFEQKQTVLLQAHMDMVPQKTPESTHRFETDPIETYIDAEGWVRARGTTLGADNGIGVAAIMAVFEAADLSHGPLEALITADEETGMFGANDLPTGQHNADILLNLDSETWGKFVIGSAGGIDITATLGYEEADTDPADAAVKVTVKGLRGGHSGLEIHEGRANANKQLVRIVEEAIRTCEARLADWHGGNMRNAIPFKAEATLTLPEENVEALKELVADWKEELAAEFPYESGLDVLCEMVPTPKKQVPEIIQDNLVSAIYACHDGVIRMIPTIPTVVETSSNLAIIDIEGGKAEIKILARSSSEEMKDYVTRTISSCLNLIGMKVTLSGSYGGWNPNPKSPVLALLMKIYKEQTGQDGIVQVDHAGLECSVILGKYPNLDVVSLGPTIRSPHTTTERCCVETVAPFWRLLTKALEEVPEK